MTRKIPLLLILLLALAAAGCAASHPVPADKYARAKAAIQSAAVMRADENPSSAVYLSRANEELGRATRLLKDGENDKAKTALLRAEADANAATHVARENWAEQEAAKTVENVRQLKAQMEGMQP